MNVGLAILAAILWGVLGLVIADAVRSLRNEKEDEIPTYVSKVQHYYERNLTGDVETRLLSHKERVGKRYVWDASSLHRCYQEQKRAQMFVLDAERAIGYDQHGNVMYTLKKTEE